VFSDQFVVATSGKGTYEITNKVESLLRDSRIRDGILTIFVQHTSCSLIVMENAYPTARRDLEEFFDRLVPENADYFEHDTEGADDMPSHIRMVLTRTSETIPVISGRMQLGAWQGIFLFEHRRAAHRRLYEHLCETTKDKPDATLEDLQPLYQAVAHGCHAGIQQKAFEKGLMDKTNKQSNDVILYDNRVVVFKVESDVMLYVVGGADENEILLYNVVLSLRDTLGILFKYVKSNYGNPRCHYPYLAHDHHFSR